MQNGSPVASPNPISLLKSGASKVADAEDDLFSSCSTNVLSKMPTLESIPSLSDIGQGNSPVPGHSSNLGMMMPLKASLPLEVDGPLSQDAFDWEMMMPLFSHGQVNLQTKSEKEQLDELMPKLQRRPPMVEISKEQNPYEEDLRSVEFTLFNISHQQADPSSGKSGASKTEDLPLWYHDQGDNLLCESQSDLDMKSLIKVSLPLNGENPFLDDAGGFAMMTPLEISEPLEMMKPLDLVKPCVQEHVSLRRRTRKEHIEDSKPKLPRRLLWNMKKEDAEEVQDKTAEKAAQNHSEDFRRPVEFIFFNVHRQQADPETSEPEASQTHELAAPLYHESSKEDKTERLVKYTLVERNLDLFMPTEVNDELHMQPQKRVQLHEMQEEPWNRPQPLDSDTRIATMKQLPDMDWNAMAGAPAQALRRKRSSAVKM